MKNRYVLMIIGVCVLFAVSGNNAFAEDPDALLLEAHKLFTAKEFSQAEQKCRETLEANPKEFNAYNIMGAIYFLKRNDRERALFFYKKSIAINPGQPLIYSRMAYLYNNLNRLDESAAMYQKGLEYDPDNLDFIHNLALLFLFEKKKPYKALSYLKTAQMKRPDDAKALYLTAVAYLYIEKHLLAIDYVTKLKEQGAQYHAAFLEDAIRRTSRGTKVSLKEYAVVYRQGVFGD